MNIQYTLLDLHLVAEVARTRAEPWIRSYDSAGMIDTAMGWFSLRRIWWDFINGPSTSGTAITRKYPLGSLHSESHELQSLVMTSLARRRRESARCLSGMFLRGIRLICDMTKSKVIRIDSERDGFRHRRCLFFSRLFVENAAQRGWIWMRRWWKW